MEGTMTIRIFDRIFSRSSLGPCSKLAIELMIESIESLLKFNPYQRLSGVNSRIGLGFEPSPIMHHWNVATF
jgi:hypothetical protein